MFTKMNSAAIAAALLFASTINANAGLVGYANFSDWSAAIPGSTLLAIPNPVPNVVDPSDPPNLIAGVEYFGTGTASVSYGSVLFATDGALGDGNFFNIGPAFSGSNGLLPVLSSQQQTIGLTNILITLASPVKAIALNFDTFFGSDVTFTLSNGEMVTLASAGNAYDLGSFFGVTDDKAFNTVLLSSTDTALSINALNIGSTVPAVPEPATWVMLLVGFFGTGLFRARRALSR
jgi:hypothetical protein